MKRGAPGLRRSIGVQDVHSVAETAKNGSASLGHGPSSGTEPLTEFVHLMIVQHYIVRLAEFFVVTICAALHACFARRMFAPSAIFCPKQQSFCVAPVSGFSWLQVG